MNQNDMDRIVNDLDDAALLHLAKRVSARLGESIDAEEDRLARENDERELAELG